MEGGRTEQADPLPGPTRDSDDYVSLDELGYAVMASEGPQKMAIFIRRTIAFHGGFATEEGPLQQLASRHCSGPESFRELLDELGSCAWISWPGRGVRDLPCPPAPARADAVHGAEPPCGPPGPPGVSAAASFIWGSSEGNSLPAPDPSQALRGTDKADFVGCGSTTESHSIVAGIAHLLVEVHMDGHELCAQPFEDLGALIVTASPWRPWHIFLPRLFSLVLRNPRNLACGLVLASSPIQQVVTDTAHSILAELGSGATSLADAAVYDALISDPALLEDAMLQSGPNAPSALGMHEWLGGTGSGSSGSIGVGSSSGSGSSSSTATGPVGSAQTVSVQPEEEVCQCPICFEDVQPGAAAMRCNGEGGVHHYFHACCLQEWIQACRRGRQATCPVCRGGLQINGHRLQEYLDGETSAQLPTEDRSFLQEIADGLRGSNGWSDMSALQKTAYVGGLLAAAGYGFMLGFTEDRHVGYTSTLILRHIPQAHQVAQGVGLVAGLLAQVIQKFLKDHPSRTKRSCS